MLNMYTRSDCENFFDHNQQVEVVFEKKDGSRRVMRCTRDLNLIPQEFHPKPLPEPEKPSDTVFPVFDIEANGWRSFAFERLESLTPIRP